MLCLNAEQQGPEPLGLIQFMMQSLQELPTGHLFHPNQPDPPA